MILTDREIAAALESRQLLIEPPPHPTAYGSTSIDLTLDGQVSRWRQYGMAGVEAPVVSPGASGFNFLEFRKAHLETQAFGDEGYILEPGQFVLTWTRERVCLPLHGRLAARVEGKSSLARCGIGVHVTAPVIHAGFEGQIQLEMFNHGSLRVRLLPGMKVCQLIFEMALGTPQKGYQGMFAGQGVGR